MLPLSRSILATLAYFDVFSYPLRIEELWRWLFVEDAMTEDVRQATPYDIELAVRRLESDGKVERVGSYVVLAGQSEYVATRAERKVASERMWQRARFVSSWLRLVPFVRFIGVVNTLAIDNVRPESDIDFLIIVRQGRLWLTRLLVTALVHALGIRRHGRKIANRVCLSFFISDRALNLKNLALPGGDPYLAFWVSSVVPMFERAGTWAAFREKNSWLTDILPNGFRIAPLPVWSDRLNTGIVRSAGELALSSVVGDMAEQAARGLQQIKMRFPTVPEEQYGESGVLMTNDILKFHEQDRRRKYREEFGIRLSQVL